MAMATHTSSDSSRCCPWPMCIVHEFQPLPRDRISLCYHANFCTTKRMLKRILQATHSPTDSHHNATARSERLLAVAVTINNMCLHMWLSWQRLIAP
jgi:hypothetical protein